MSKRNVVSHWDYAGFLLAGLVTSAALVWPFIIVLQAEHSLSVSNVGDDSLTDRAPLIPGGTELGGSVEPDYRRMAKAASSLCGVPERIFLGLVARESSWRHYNEAGEILRSSAGAVGLAQVMPRTAKEFAANMDVTDPWENLLLGACILRREWEHAKSWTAALHSYNAGRWRKKTTAHTISYARDILEAN